MWFEKSVLYHIYPFGFCGALDTEDNESTSNISKVSDWICHMKELGIDAVYFSPVFESDFHGYDTKDYTTIDRRIGTNKDFAKVCNDLHKEGIRVILDGVFNHVGRGFWAFEDVKKNKENSQYCSWFNINFGADSPFSDGFWYEGWEGHYDLVKLNLHNEEVVNYLLTCVKGWVDEFNIDGVRLDVAYMLDKGFVQKFSEFVSSIKSDFFTLGEIIHGDYNTLVGDGLLNSCTNYECYKGLYSSFNSMNMFEIAHSINRQFGKEQWTLYKGKHLTVFADNHDVDRLASTLTEPKHLPILYGLMFAMPGIPCIYYGSEWGVEGKKEGGNDGPLRPCIEKPIANELTVAIGKYAKIHKAEDAIIYGDYEQIALTNGQYVFLREYKGEKIYAAINASDESALLSGDKLKFDATDLITGEKASFDGSMELEPYSVYYWKVN